MGQSSIDRLKNSLSHDVSLSLSPGIFSVGICCLKDIPTQWLYSGLKKSCLWSIPIGMWSTKFTSLDKTRAESKLLQCSFKLPLAPCLRPLLLPNVSSSTLAPIQSKFTYLPELLYLLSMDRPRIRLPTPRTL